MASFDIFPLLFLLEQPVTDNSTSCLCIGGFGRCDTVCVIFSVGREQRFTFVIWIFSWILTDLTSAVFH